MNEPMCLRMQVRGFCFNLKIVDIYIVLRYSDYIEVRYIVVR